MRTLDIALPVFDGAKAIEMAKSFVTRRWEGQRAPASFYLEGTGVPVSLSRAIDWTDATTISPEDDLANKAKTIANGLAALPKKFELNGTNLVFEWRLLAGHAPSHFLRESNHKR
jgi:hypothetical protein